MTSADLCPERTEDELAVEWTIGSPNALTVLTVETMFLRSRSGSIERTVPTLRRLVVDQHERCVLRGDQVVAKLI